MSKAKTLYLTIKDGFEIDLSFSEVQIRLLSDLFLLITVRNAIYSFELTATLRPQVPRMNGLSHSLCIVI